MNLFVFISGKASAGKDSFAKSLFLSKLVSSGETPITDMKKINSLFSDPLGFEQFDTLKVNFAPFADEVRRELCRLNPEVDFKRLQTSYEYKTRYRKEMIEIGHGYRQRDPDIWVNKHWDYVQSSGLLLKPSIILIPDTRYQNELKYAQKIQETLGKDALVYSVRIEASLSTRLCRMSPDGARSYLAYGRYNPGECELDNYQDFDYVISNNDKFHGTDVNYKLHQYFDTVCHEVLDTFDHVNS